jgi:hypothetical protein
VPRLDHEENAETGKNQAIQLARERGFASWRQLKAEVGRRYVDCRVGPRNFTPSPLLLASSPREGRCQLRVHVLRRRESQKTVDAGPAIRERSFRSSNSTPYSQKIRFLTSRSKVSMPPV